MYNAAGNVTYDNQAGYGYGYAYNNAGRMESFSINGVVQAEYVYNALGQQTIRRLTQAGQTIHSVHDADGNRLAEYQIDNTTGASTLLQEYICHDGVPVAVVDDTMDLSRFDAAPLIAFTATKETNYGTETDGRISPRCSADRANQRADAETGG